MSTFSFGKIKGWHTTFWTQAVKDPFLCSKVLLILKGLIDKNTEKLRGKGQREKRRKRKNKEARKEREGREPKKSREAIGYWMHNCQQS